MTAEKLRVREGNEERENDRERERGIVVILRSRLSSQRVSEPGGGKEAMVEF